MAANKNLDPTTCSTAADAFRYPLPQVRQFHRSLTAELDEKNARLRTLVGGSYRQLLATAETILQMREDIRHVEDKLGRVGQGCGRNVIGEKAVGLAKLGNNLKGGERKDGLQWVARMKVLEMCGIAVGKLLRRGEAEDEGKGKNLILAAKVLVLSRLLAKSVGDQAPQRNSDQRIRLEETKRKLGVLRRRLIRAIDRTLERVGSDNREALVQALSAYSLADSSGARDVLRHFLHVRGEAIALAFEADQENPQNSSGVVKALDLYAGTLLDVQALVPRRLSEALLSIKSKPLLKDEGIRQLEALGLDVCEKQFGDEILFFIPYLRHDDIEGPQAAEMLHGWAEKASAVVLEGLTNTLERLTEFKTVVDLRQRILELWIKEGGKAKGFDPSILLDGLRTVVNERLVALLESRITKLHLVATEVEATMGSWRSGNTDVQHSLWDSSMLDLDVNNGAALFKQGVLSRTYGRNDVVSRAFKGYQTWRHLVDEIVTVIEQLKKQRWDEDLEDVEDDEGLESRNNLLSVEDPQFLQDRLNSSLTNAYDALHEKMESLLKQYSESEEIEPISVYILRVLRDVRTDLPKLGQLQQFGLSLIGPLHETLIESVLKLPLDTFTKSFKRSRVLGRALWEGDPELPLQPSPATFKLLHSLTLSMGKSGADLWSPSAVAGLKKYLVAEISQRWESALKPEVHVNGTMNGESLEHVKEDETQGKKDIMIQSLFDLLILRSALEDSRSTETGFKDLEKVIEIHSGLEPTSIKRLEQSAKEYWKRSNLLFGLLTAELGSRGL